MNNVSYLEFLARKRKKWTSTGIDVDAQTLPGALYPWQTAIVQWALRKGCAAIFADCGLGKTFMQSAWANALNVPTLMLAPLCVAEQTSGEAAKLGIDVRYARNQSEVASRITITNYERIDGFDISKFDAVVLDESSILKAFDGKTRTQLIESFQKTPYRLCCTATPSPNDIAELANHAEFLGLQRRPEFLASWFVHDDEGWRMKKHAVQPFFQWLATWALAVRKPSDIGYADDGFTLPPLELHEIVTGDCGITEPLRGIQGRMKARRASLADRVAVTADMVNADGESWIVWCGINDEAAAMTARIPGAVNVQGSDSYTSKRNAVERFVAGDIRVLVTKPKILGFGMNFQHCHNMAFVGMSDSYETYYQCVRRCWRFGQREPVHAHIVVSEPERVIVDNVRRKEAIAIEMSQQLLAHMRDFERRELSA
jgi:superfamily II DNA or RNA helicase